MKRERYARGRKRNEREGIDRKIDREGRSRKRLQGWTESGEKIRGIVRHTRKRIERG